MVLSAPVIRLLPLNRKKFLTRALRGFFYKQNYLLILEKTLDIKSITLYNKRVKIKSTLKFK